MTEARAPVAQVPPWACAAKMQRGHVRRWVDHAGAPFSYVVCCPRCARPIMAMVDDWGLEEGPIVTSVVPYGTGVRAFDHPTSITSTKAFRCYGCGGVLRATGAEVVLEFPAG